MSAVMEPLTEVARRVKRGRIGIPYVSNVTDVDHRRGSGRLLLGAARAQHREVRGRVDVLLADSPVVCIEVGPGQTLGGLVRRHASASLDTGGRHYLAGAPRGPSGGREILARAVGHVWLAGVRPDWMALHTPYRRRRVELPPYPFERKRHWLDARPTGEEAARPRTAREASRC